MKPHRWGHIKNKNDMDYNKGQLPAEDKIWMDHYFPDIEYAVPPHEQLQDLQQITDCSIPQEEIELLLENYHMLGYSSNEGEDIKRLTVLCFNIRMEAYIVAAYEFDKVRDEAIRMDLLKLHKACKEPEALAGKIEIRSRRSTIRLDNRFNWVQDVMIRLFLKEHLNDTSEDGESLKKGARAGRKAYDERAGIIMKGVFQMLSESHDFPTPMPNVLCNFILFYLELCGIHPSHQKVGAQWVRAQLRYLISRIEES